MTRALSVLLLLILVSTNAPAGEFGDPRKTDPAQRFTWPLCTAPMADFGYRVDAFTGRVAFHTGLDLGPAFGLIVRAGANGTVTQARVRGPYGLVVEIDHGDGYRTRYAHLQSASVREGDAVGRGETIAASGSSGRSTGPHLHFEVWYNDVVRNPLHYLNAECAP